MHCQASNPPVAQPDKTYILIVVIDVAVAVRLRDGGLRWTPARGDWFVIVNRGMDEDQFVLSDMTIELQGHQIGFNGTAEWALDSVDQDDAVWLPREHQLRDLLGNSFRTLTRPPGGWQVEIEIAGAAKTFAASTAEAAYARALLFLVIGE